MTDNPQINDTPQPATLEDLLAPEHATVIVQLEDGKEVTVNLRIPTAWQQLQIRQQVSDPAPPVSGIDPKTKRPIFDFNNPAYLAAREQAEMDRNYRMLLFALELPIPGNTDDEKLEFLKTKFSARLTRQLNVGMAVLVGGGQARIAGRAATFLGNGANGTADL